MDTLEGMPPPRPSWKIRIPAGHTTYNVRFWHKGKRYDLGTGESDLAKATEEAERINAAIVTGRSPARPVAGTLAQAAAGFLEAYEVDHAKGTFETVGMYFKAHFLPFFGSFDAFTEAGYADFVRERISKTTRVTVRKELRQMSIHCARFSPGC